MANVAVASGHEQPGERGGNPGKAAWMFPLLLPGLLAVGPILYFVLRVEWLLWLSVILISPGMSFLERILGEDEHNPAESSVSARPNDRFYRYLVYTLVPVPWVAFTFGAWLVATHPLPWHAVLAVMLIAGIAGGFGNTVGHELGHGRSRFERWLARIALAPGAYGHFLISHNRVHHLYVATPEDPSSPRMGETLYRFALREMPGGFLRAWHIEKARLIRLGKSPWSLRNEVVLSTVFVGSYWAGMAIWLGVSVLPFLLLAAFWVQSQHAIVNYIEHYGFLRRKLPNGRYEPVQPHHSWNSNNLLSNRVMLQLPRHSDHHVNPLRQYQYLQHFDDQPTLPSGYYSLLLLAYIPPLWFRIMDPRLVNVVGGDISRINFEPSRRDELIRKYRLHG